SRLDNQGLSDLFCASSLGSVMKSISIFCAVIAALLTTSAVRHTWAGTLVPVVSVSNSRATFVSDISDKNIIAGNYQDADFNNHAFFGSLDGQYTTFDAGDGGYTGAVGINDSGWITVRVFDSKCSDACQLVRKPDGSLLTVMKGEEILNGEIGRI